MKFDDEHIDALIAKYLAGEALPEDAIALEDWKAASPENKAYFEASYQAYHRVSYTPVDKARMYANILNTIDVPAQKSKRIDIRTYFTPMRIAASFIVLSLIGILAKMLREDAPQQFAIVSVDSVKTTVLKDGSSVVLNKHTTLTVVSDFASKERRLKLEGEAFFEVKHDEEVPFIVEAGGLLIQDIGTAFNIKSLPQSDTVFVVVTEGVVELSSASEKVQLKQNESAIYIKSTHAIIANTLVMPNATSYKTNMFSFKNQTLGDLVETINQVYGPVLLIGNPQLKACRITVDFNQESPETMAIVLSETLGLTYERVGNQFVLNGEVCVQ